MKTIVCRKGGDNMTSEERKMKELYKWIEALNINLIDIAKSLRILSGRDVSKGEKGKKTRWRPAIKIDGLDPELPNPEEYDWVLVKIRDDSKFLPSSEHDVYNVPHIAEYRNGKWFSNEWDTPYETVNVPFEVVWWRPIDE